VSVSEAASSSSSPNNKPPPEPRDSPSSATADEEPPTTASDGGDAASNGNKRYYRRTGPETPADDASPDLKAVREYWERTFDDIRNVHEESAAVGTGALFNQWKQFASGGKSAAATTKSRRKSDDGPQTASKPRRFEGFLTWDRLLQEWADDIQEYINKAQEETGVEYPFSTYGKPPPSSSVDDFSVVDGDEDVEVQEASAVATPTAQSTASVASSSATPKTSKVSLPVPAPAKPGEAVVPHTVISDKSKHVWIVTTASLPWRTGTAVNPLLRAAYLSDGRKDAGGSVTLMLPWLERPEDQVRVYGSKQFETPDDQEQFIRDWLRESANMPEASEEVNIQWYTAWQNPVENSIYSMGDITALIPNENADICILEEPEHLNWYDPLCSPNTYSFP